MKFLITVIARAFQLSGLLTLPLAIYFGESEKSMALELQYLLLGSLLFGIGYFIDNKFVKT